MGPQSHLSWALTGDTKKWNFITCQESTAIEAKQNKFMFLSHSKFACGVTAETSKIPVWVKTPSLDTGFIV